MLVPPLGRSGSWKTWTSNGVAWISNAPGSPANRTSQTIMYRWWMAMLANHVTSSIHGPRPVRSPPRMTDWSGAYGSLGDAHTGCPGVLISRKRSGVASTRAGGSATTAHCASGPSRIGMTSLPRKNAWKTSGFSGGSPLSTIARTAFGNGGIEGT